MGIQFYNGLSNYAAFNSYKRDIPVVDPEEVKRQLDENSQAEAKKTEAVETLSPYQQSKIDSRSQVALLEDVSLTFNKEETFDYIGQDASVKSLDMEKAISDMKKDSILEEYQYFVGDSKNLFSDDGIVIAK